MRTLLRNLSIGRRLLVIVYTSLFFFSVIAVVFWYTSAKSEQMSDRIDHLNTLKEEIAETKHLYNALRGHLGFAFIINTETEADRANQLKEWFKNHQALLKESTNRVKKHQNLSPELQELKLKFLAKVEDLSALSQNNFDKILNSTSSDSLKYQEVKEFLFSEYSTSFQNLINTTQTLEKDLEAESHTLILEIQSQENTAKWGIIIFIVIAGIILFLFSNLLIQSITRPINQAKSNLEQLSEGELPDVILNENKDEVSRMIGSLHQLVVNQKQLMDFTRQVAQNNFSVEASMYNGKGPIVQALLQMRNSLKESAQKEAQKNWHNEGLSKLSQLLRNKNMDHQTLHATLIQFVVKYVKANQGSIFHVVEEDKQLYLDVVATYAYERRKYLKKRLEWGEGLIGSACQERDIIYLTDIPENYVRISSGLGTANPTCLLIVPFLSEQGVEGALELASFQPLEPYQITFLQEACNAIAAELTILKTNQKIQQLLAQSQLQAEELRAQEEEMRQNMEELAATQEEMERKTREMEDTLSQFQHQ
ncbi:GAF domain-containing protein [Xanthocytophaga agilis]|uniref:GAF domain-containing protein n=1 Tax=Xanthocytophaga agilis TaxID=3048010 RepID=A0AAE3RA90_9BACT|nr:GAF domain-containing protein [Xanthocytophaga agilis]MDJ1506549.1 GAF domain-containing protein [Xanthocytophaga agilis]